MLHRLRHLKGYDIHSTTGHLGRARDFFFDDHQWMVRYLVADTGRWLSSRQVLISPTEILRIEDADQEVYIALTKEQIEESPRVDADQPVARQHESALARYYGWPEYWESLVLQTAGIGPAQVDSSRTEATPSSPTLRSVEEVTGYGVEATDGPFGKVEDFLADGDWAVRYMIIGTHRWIPGRKVLIAPSWIEAIGWSSSRVRVGHTQDEIKGSPSFDANHFIDSEYESKLHAHYGRAEYWLAGKHDKPIRIG